MTTFARKKTLIVSLVCIGLACFLSAMALFEYWLRHSPATPDPQTRRVAALNQHGYYFYVTQRQKALFDWLLFSGPIVFVSAGLLESRWKTIYNPIDDAPKKFY